MLKLCFLFFRWENNERAMNVWRTTKEDQVHDSRAGTDRSQRDVGRKNVKMWEKQGWGGGGQSNCHSQGHDSQAGTSH